MNTLDNRIKELSLRNKFKIFILRLKGIYYRLTGKKPVLLIDQDEVMFQLVPYLLRVYNDEHGTNFNESDITDWDLRKLLGKEVNEYFKRDDFFEHLEPVEHMVEVLTKIKETNRYHFSVVTAGNEHSHIGKIKSIKQHTPFIHSDDVIFTSKKGMIKGDLLLDDAPHNIMDFNKTKGLPVVFDKLINQDLKGFIRVSDWHEFFFFIEYLFYNKKY